MLGTKASKGCKAVPSLKLLHVQAKDFDGVSDDEDPWVVLGQDRDVAATQAWRSEVGYSTSTIQEQSLQMMACSARPTVVAAPGWVKGWPPTQKRDCGVVPPYPNIPIDGAMPKTKLIIDPVEEGGTRKDQQKKLLHDQERCRPCSFHTGKPGGCRWGIACSFCHLCDRYTHNLVKRRLRQGQAAARLPFPADASYSEDFASESSI
eukprot:TRINITY_DN123636_c0_g1_i1.p1 TRINITY_DN123636_c0_g1~~TRINITY_DN123636_c0_g1_i1.p1  ORF type:complete len:206 (-),score=13.23 TRINITY_DN123636_c0_g1_i1:251-868(-)